MSNPLRGRISTTETQLVRQWVYKEESGFLDGMGHAAGAAEKHAAEYFMANMDKEAEVMRTFAQRIKSQIAYREEQFSEKFALGFPLADPDKCPYNKAEEAAGETVEPEGVEEF